jgi:hypothetical protein
MNFDGWGKQQKRYKKRKKIIIKIQSRWNAHSTE